ncbi:hypothetical protein [Arenicella xantha]|uniref:Uncharacterized protein n=1 Tax=Arenicella xantha TaxID=644221 RepID=A0A395JIV1_9GAMM|nr:hypothetical protein [Arenicella xantha]RBP48561.1 hypothetical protein DFR28_10647 [Arenicella xantha]
MRRIIRRKWVFIACLIASVTCNASDSVSSDIEEQDKILSNNIWVFIGEFEAFDNEAIINDANMPGGAYVTRSFKVNKVLQTFGEEVPAVLKIKVPIHLIDLEISRQSQKQSLKRMLSIEKEIQILKSGARSESKLLSVQKELDDIRYLLSAQGLALHFNYDFSMTPGKKYLMAFMKRQDIDTFILDDDLKDFMVLGAGLPADVFLTREQRHQS